MQSFSIEIKLILIVLTVKPTWNIVDSFTNLIVISKIFRSGRMFLDNLYKVIYIISELHLFSVNDRLSV